MRPGRRMRLVLAPLLIAAGLGIAFIAPAHAGTGNQICYTFTGPKACLNAWGGGPDVNVYESLGTSNNDFTLIQNGSNYGLEFTGNGANDKCVGDGNNSSSNASTYLDPCWSGWGTNFTINYSVCGNGLVAFHNNHWGGWLGPANNYANGSNFYLNNTSFIGCFTFYGAA